MNRYLLRSASRPQNPYLVWQNKKKYHCIDFKLAVVLPFRM